MPPLRERTDDIIPIFRKFVTEFSAEYDSVFKGFSDDAKELLTSYRWPGNVRELRNVAEQLVVLEKSKFIDTDTLKKYLKGRQQTGSADNLPMLSDEAKKSHEAGSSFGKGDRELVYRALVELRSEISDMKKMLATFLYGAFSGRELKALPQNIQSEVERSSMSDFDIGRESDEEESIGAQPFTEADISEEQEEEISSENAFDKFFNGKEIPSIEKTEQFLIEQALQKYDGNRRKASEALGISERTLYRKLDQYGLE
ncbi:MAG: helix-turn-helix domain-containing protein [Balneolaceae bacterium]|nr:helix-turn-helix domain-containing protein [Balneolaceae bacterium]